MQNIYNIKKAAYTDGLSIYFIDIIRKCSNTFKNPLFLLCQTARQSMILYSFIVFLTLLKVIRIFVLNNIQYVPYYHALSSKIFDSFQIFVAFRFVINMSTFNIFIIDYFPTQKYSSLHMRSSRE